MRTTSLASLLAAMATLAAGVEAQDCAKNLHIMVARGTGEEEGPGATGSLARRIARQIGDSDISALDYPATALIPTYFDSVREGDDAMSKALRDYAKECPDTKIALMGYSQVRPLRGPTTSPSLPAAVARYPVTQRAKTPSVD